MTLSTRDQAVGSTVAPDFRFDGVVVDQTRFRLVVDGNERAVPPLALRLLLVLCEAMGRVVTRRELFDRLWPRQEIGDESLIQQTARLRESLGPYGHRVVTVRRVGLRLDTQIERVDAAALEIERMPARPAAPTAAISAEPTPAPDYADEPATTPRGWWRRGLPLLAVLALLTLLTLLICLLPDPDLPLPGGQGLTEADLAGEKSSTADALKRALALDAQGRRDEALVLLEITSEADPQAALPAAYLALFNQARGERDEALRWQRLALQRLQDQPAQRMRLLLRPIDHLRTLPDSETMASLNLIAMTPDGGESPSLSRAHAHLGRSERALARAQLERFDWDYIDAVNVPVVLGDLASLGAGVRAESLYRQHLAQLDASSAAEIRARFAATRGDFTLAGRQIAAALAAQPNDRAWVRQTLLALHYALEAGQTPSAEAMIASLLRDPRLAEYPNLAFNVALLRAGLPTLSDAAASAVLADALALTQQMEFEPGCWEVALLAALRRAPATLDVRCQATPAELSTVPGLEDLLRAAEAYRSGQRESALNALEKAASGGVDQSLYAAHANALRQKLGLPMSGQAFFDPPYPVWSRHSARRLGVAE